MAKDNNNQGKTSKRKSKFTPDEQLAWKMGKIQASLNKDCRVRDSYENGKKAAIEGKKKSKPLY